MPWKERIFIAVVAAVAIGTVGMILALRPTYVPTASNAASATAVAPQDEPLVTYLDPFTGSASATKTLVLYTNYACPFCGEEESELETLVANHPEVRVVWKDLPNGEAGTQDAAEAAQCAKNQGVYWDYHQLLRGDGDWSQATLAMHASSLGIDTNAFASCLQNHDMKPFVDRTVSEAEALGIQATPTLFIGKKRYEGLLTYDQLEAAIR